MNCSFFDYTNCCKKRGVHGGTLAHAVNTVLFMADTHFREPLRFFHAGLCGPAADEAVTCLNLGFLEGFSTGTWVDQGQPMGL